MTVDTTPTTLNYGDEHTEKLADQQVRKASTIILCNAENDYIRFRKVKSRKHAECLYAQKLIKDWFKHHKTKLVPLRKSWKVIGKEGEERGVLVDPDEERRKYYEKLDSLPQEAVILACSKDLYLFSEYYFRHYLKHPSSKLHYWLYNLFNDEIPKRKGCKWAIAAPRGNSKSSLTTLFLPMWCLLYQKKNFIIIISDTSSQAEDFLREVRMELLGNVYIKKHFPECCAKTEVWRQDEIVTSNNVRVLALGAQSKILGRRHGANRPDLIVADDLENMDSVLSGLMRERTKQWFNKEVLKAGDVAGTTDFIVVGTIKHEDSLLSNLVDPSISPSWNSKVFRSVINFATNEDMWGQWAEIYSNKEDEKRFSTARKFFEDNYDKMMEGVEVLWPAGESYYDLMCMKLESDVSFASEKQNEPVDRSKCLIQPEELRYYEESELEGRNLLIFGALDPALGKSKKVTLGDYASISTVAKCQKSGKVFVLDDWSYKRNVDSQIKEIFRKHGRYNYHKFGIETTAFQVVLKDHVEKLSRYAQIHIPIEEIKHGNTKKESRIEWMYPFLKDGTVYFHKSQKQLIEQVCNWTPDGRALYDDRVDALSMALKLALQRYFKMLTW